MPGSGAAATRRVRGTFGKSLVGKACAAVEVSTGDELSVVTKDGSRTYHAFSGISAFHGSVGFQCHPLRSDAQEHLLYVGEVRRSGCRATN